MNQDIRPNLADMSNEFAGWLDCARFRGLTNALATLLNKPCPAMEPVKEHQDSSCPVAEF